jgi:hypothetical protein
MLLRALFGGAFLAGLLTACAMVDPVDSRYDTVSRSLSKARNEAIFLNLVRASHDYPLSFTTIANVTPTMTNTSSLALPLFSIGPPNCLLTTVLSASPNTRTSTCSYGTGALGAATAVSNNTASNSTAVSTNFNVATQETSAFYGGFLKPIDLTILAYFIRQGYPRELLFWLFIDSFELKTARGALGYHYNPKDDLGCDPNDRIRHRCFIDWLHSATLNGLTVEEKIQQRSSTAKSGGEGSSATAKPTTYTYARFCFNKVLAGQAQALAAPEFLSANKLDVELSQVHEDQIQCGSKTWHPEKKANDPQEDILPLTFANDTVTFRIIPRSAYGVFEFLGTLMKLEREGWTPSDYPPDRVVSGGYPSDRPWVGEMPPRLATVHEDPRLITVQPGGECFVHTWFNDGEYCVPETATTTKQIFSLLAQLIAIQTAASDLSITPVVRVIQ